MSRRIAICIGCLATAVLVGAASSAAAQDPNIVRPPLLEALLKCREIAAADARLACFDGAAVAFDTAERMGEITVVDRARAEATRTRLFGLNLGTANIFEGLRLDEPVQAIESTLALARQDQNGKWLFTFADGSTWRQLDTERLSPQPRPGQAVRVRQGALNSYLLSVANGRSVRARREP